jgi:ribosomal protein S15
MMKNTANTGVVETQINIFKKRIKILDTHMSKNKHDYVTKLSLTKLRNKYRKMLRYLKNTSTKRSSSVVIIK